MTRAEYEKKYGASPAAPVKMTRAEYEAKYGTPKPATPVAETYGATFPYQQGDTALTAGLKAAGNVPSSLFNLGKNIVTAATNPIETAKGILNVAEGVGNKFAENTVGRVIKKTTGIDTSKQNSKESEAAFQALASTLRDRYGSIENFGRTATNDPVGVGADIIAALQGGAALAGKTAQLNSAISKTAQVAAKPVVTAGTKAASAVSRTTSFATSQATGLSPSTIKTVIEQPKAFSKANQANASRSSLGQQVQSAIDKHLDDLADTGKGYEVVRQSGTAVALPKNFLDDALAQHGLSVSKDGKVVASTKSITRNQADLNALQNIVSNWRGKTKLDADEFLNLRSDLAELAKYDAAKTPASATVSRSLRSALNQHRTQVPGLKELDELYSPIVEQLNAIKRDYINPRTGELKDGAASKIANLTGKGKEQVLDRLEAILPGVTQKIQVLKAVEDIEAASGLKVGTYGRAVVAGSGLLTGNVPVIVAAILAQPEVAVPLIRGYGLTKQALAPVLLALRSEVGALNNFSFGPHTEKYIREHPPGLTIKKTGATQRDIATGDNAKAPATKAEWPTTASKPSTDVNTSTGNAPTGKEGVSAQRADTSGPFEGGDSALERNQPRGTLGTSGTERGSKSKNVTASFVRDVNSHLPPSTRTVYHGTDAEFSEFDDAALGSNPNGGLASKVGHWFSDDPEWAKNHGANVKEVLIDLKNPRVYEPEEWGKLIAAKTDFVALRKKLQSEGYDGIYIKERLTPSANNKLTFRSPAQWAVFDSKAIKSSPSIPKELEPLAAEARKYKSAEEFERAYTQSDLKDLSNYEAHRFGRALDPYTSKESITDFLNGTSELGSLDSLKYDNPVVYKTLTSKGDTVTIYRAVPKHAPDNVQLGDYVALERRYAEMHLDSVLEGQQKTTGKVVEMKVPKSDVVWMGADYNEWVYSPQKLRDQYPGGLTDFFNKVKGTKRDE